MALGASLQDKLLAGINGLTLNTLQVNPVQGVESLSSTATAGTVDTTDVSNEITFTFSISGDEAALKQALSNLEKSIRTIDLTSIKIENQGQKRVLSVSGRGFYEPALTVGLKDEVVRQ